MVTESRYIDEEYREKLDVLAIKHPDVSSDWIDAQFVRSCKRIDAVTKDGTPIEAIRRIAFSRLTSPSSPL